MAFFRTYESTHLEDDEEFLGPLEQVQPEDEEDEYRDQDARLEERQMVSTAALEAELKEAARRKVRVVLPLVCWLYTADRHMSGHICDQIRPK